MPNNIDNNNNKELVKDMLLKFAGNEITFGEAFTTLYEKIQLSAYTWVPYNFYDIESRPLKAGKYFVQRKDGKVHWETWNGSGFAYNNNVITHYCIIKTPFELEQEAQK